MALFQRATWQGCHVVCHGAQARWITTGVCARLQSARPPSWPYSQARAGSGSGAYFPVPSENTGTLGGNCQTDKLCEVDRAQGCYVSDCEPSASSETVLP